MQRHIHPSLASLRPPHSVLVQVAARTAMRRTRPCAAEAWPTLPRDTHSPNSLATVPAGTWLSPVDGLDLLDSDVLHGAEGTCHSSGFRDRVRRSPSGTATDVESRVAELQALIAALRL